MPACDLLKSLHVTGTTPQMHAYDTRGARSDQSFYLARVDIMGSLVYITEDGYDTLPQEGMGRGYKGERRDDDLAGETGCLGGDLQPDRGVAYGDTVPDPHHLGDRVLQLLHKGTVVGEPLGVQALVDTPKQSPPITDVGTSDVKRLAERGIAPEYRQVF